MRLQFSSDVVPPDVRKDAIDAAFGVHVQGMVDFPDEASPRVALELQTLAGVHIARIDSSPIRLVTPSADDGVVYLSITAAGGGQIDTNGSGRTVRAGDFNVMLRNRRCTTVVAERSDILSIAIPHTQLVPRLASEDNLRAPMLRSRPAARLLQCYAAALLEGAADVAPDDEAVFAGHITDLAAMALGAKRDEAELARKGGVRAARRRAIKADIAANLGAPELSLEWIARRQGVSGAYVRALFSDEGTSFTDYVLAERLHHVHALLASPYLTHQNIASLALMAGFGDISWFNHSFPRRFGVTPSDVRQARRGLAGAAE